MASNEEQRRGPAGASDARELEPGSRPSGQAGFEQVGGERIDKSAREAESGEKPKVKRTTRAKNAVLEKTPQKLKNPSDTQVRIRTGAVYIGLNTIAVLLGNLPTAIILAVTAAICAGEFYFMERADAKMPNEVIGVVAAALFPLAMYFFGFKGVVIVLAFFLLALLIWYVFWIYARVSDVSICFFGAAYTGLLLCGLLVIRMSIDEFWGGILLLLLFLSVWGNDAFAYLAGRKFGKHKLAPRVSPKKTWEGFFGGIVSSMVFWCLMSLVPGVSMSIPQALLFGVVCGSMEVLGDLAESRIKRNAGVKDSGTIMPGHGGLLDRCDSLFLASITACLLLVLGGCIPFSL